MVKVFLPVFIVAVIAVVGWLALAGVSFVYTAAFGVPVNKLVIAKDHGVEHGAVFMGTGNNTGVAVPTTDHHYILVAEDGTWVEVTPGTWHTTQVGQAFTTKWWEK